MQPEHAHTDEAQALMPHNCKRIRTLSEQTQEEHLLLKDLQDLQEGSQGGREPRRGTEGEKGGERAGGVKVDEDWRKQHEFVSVPEWLQVPQAWVLETADWQQAPALASAASKASAAKKNNGSSCAGFFGRQFRGILSRVPRVASDRR